VPNGYKVDHVSPPTGQPPPQKPLGKAEKPKSSVPSPQPTAFSFVAAELLPLPEASLPGAKFGSEYFRSSSSSVWFGICQPAGQALFTAWLLGSVTPDWTYLQLGVQNISSNVYSLPKASQFAVSFSKHLPIVPFAENLRFSAIQVCLPIFTYTYLIPSLGSQNWALLFPWCILVAPSVKPAHGTEATDELLETALPDDESSLELEDEVFLELDEIYELLELILLGEISCNSPSLQICVAGLKS
jgi:hypothetical protein